MHDSDAARRPYWQLSGLDRPRDRSPRSDPPGFVGKYTRFKIRRSGPPMRSGAWAHPNTTTVTGS